MLDDLLFGAATSAYQIEGAWDQDGKCPSIWDEISHGKSRIKISDNQTGDMACDHYHRWKEDIQYMKKLGLQAYRFSISWSRICTNKYVCTNLKGIKFYQNLVAGLKKAGIEPFVTLYHWDLPKWLDDIGGWANPKSVDYFRCYAETMFKALPEVKHWITFNEPAVFLPNYWGHNNLPKAIKHVLLAHGKTIKHADNNKIKIGISLNLMPFSPCSSSVSSLDRTAVINMEKIQNRIWLDPIFRGTLPDGINKLFGFKGNPLKFSNDEKEIISTPIDFLGINYYASPIIKYSKQNPPLYAESVSSDAEKDDIGFEIKPQGLFKLLKDLKKRYGNMDMYITENGCAYNDYFETDFKIHDIKRIEYIRKHLYWVNESIKKGVKLKGYFYWSLMDNFEWMYGYYKRFGLIYIHYPSQTRLCKKSFYWYRNIIRDKKFRETELLKTK